MLNKAMAMTGLRFALLDEAKAKGNFAITHDDKFLREWFFAAGKVAAYKQVLFLNFDDTEKQITKLNQLHEEKSLDEALKALKGLDDEKEI